MMTDPIADMLTRIRNANTAMHDSVRMPSSKLKVALAKILVREGYISDFSVKVNEGKPGSTLEISMKYSEARARTNAEGRALLDAFGFPFKREGQN